MAKLKKWYFNKYLADMTADELMEEQEMIDASIILLGFVFAFVGLGGVL